MTKVLHLPRLHLTHTSCDLLWIKAPAKWRNVNVDCLCLIATWYASVCVSANILSNILWKTLVESGKESKSSLMDLSIINVKHPCCYRNQIFSHSLPNIVNQIIKRNKVRHIHTKHRHIVIASKRIQCMITRTKGVHKGALIWSCSVQGFELAWNVAFDPLHESKRIYEQCF